MKRWSARAALAILAAAILYGLHRAPARLSHSYPIVGHETSALGVIVGVIVMSAVIWCIGWLVVKLFLVAFR